MDITFVLKGDSVCWDKTLQRCLQHGLASSGWAGSADQGLLIPPVQMSIGLYFKIIFYSFFFPSVNCRCSLQKTSWALSSYLSQTGVYPNGELIAALWLWLLTSQLEKHPGVFWEVIHPSVSVFQPILCIAAVSV